MGGVPDRCWVPFLVVGMLLTGSANTLSKKVAYQTESDGEHWHKPWTCTLVMFTGELMCLCLFAWRQKGEGCAWFTCRRATPADALSGGGSSYADLTRAKQDRDSRGRGRSAGHFGSAITLRSGLVCFLPACCDLGGTTLSGIGLLFTTASVWQMLRGSIILFTGVLSVVFLKRKLERFKWVGMAITIVGITIVGVSSVNAPLTPSISNCCCQHGGRNYTSSGSTTQDFDACTQDPNRKMVSPLDDAYAACAGAHEDHSSHMTGIGDLLIIVSQLMSGFQMVVEEKFLKGEGGHKLPSEFVVGCEGFFGAVMMTVIFIPLLMHLPRSWTGVYEDIPEGFQQLADHGALFGTVFLYWCSIAFYNFFGLSVAGKLSAVHRTLVDACRTVVVWVVSVSLYYGSSHGGEPCTTNYGESWHGVWSAAQLVGFLIMMLGTFTYYQVLRLPCLPAAWYQQPKLTLGLGGDEDEEGQQSLLPQSDSD